MTYHFQPELCIGIGERSHFYTLRMSHPVFTSGGGAMGNAVVNGVYQGKVSKGWHHVQNLSQNADEAVAKAEEIAKEIGIPLISTSAAELGEQLDKIKRATAEEVAAAEERERAKSARIAAMVAAQDQLAMEAAAAGYVPYGRNAGAKVEHLSPGYIGWLLDKREELEGWARALADYAHEHADWARPWPTKPGFAGEPKQRLKGLKARVEATIPYENQFGGGWIVIAVTEDGHKVKQFCSGVLWGEPGDIVVIDGTVKSTGLQGRGRNHPAAGQVPRAHPLHRPGARQPAAPGRSGPRQARRLLRRLRDPADL